jgi:hypothetical protein
MIYVECRPDLTLVQALTQLPRREIAHELKGKYEVMKRLSSLRNARAMVDEDPGANQPAYLCRMQVLRDLPQRGLKIVEDVSRNNRVVILCPKLEDWIIRAARDAELDLSNSRYNLPNSPTRLHREITFDLRKFERLVQDLKSAPRLRCLHGLLNL